MKKQILISLFCLFFTTTLFAQDWSGYIFGELYPGYIIKTDGTKTDGFIQAQDKGHEYSVWGSNQTKVIFFTEADNRKTKVVYKPNDVKEYKIAEKVYRSLNYSGGLTAKVSNFLLLIEDGHIAKYVWYTTEDKNGETTYVENVVYQKGAEKPFEASTLAMGFAKKVSELVSDYPELAEKVRNKAKGYGMLNLEKIIREYNDWYAVQNGN